MVHYRRNFLPGASYFFTIALLNRTSFLLSDHIAILRNVFQLVQAQRPFTLDVVVLPDQLHCLWTLPRADADYPSRWRAIKTRFSREILRGEWRSASRKEGGTWNLAKSVPGAHLV